jgi:hypothetical protein
MRAFKRRQKPSPDGSEDNLARASYHDETGDRKEAIPLSEVAEVHEADNNHDHVHEADTDNAYTRLHEAPAKPLLPAELQG